MDAYLIAVKYRNAEISYGELKEKSDFVASSLISKIDSKISISISRLSSDKCSIAELIVGYLKEQNMKNSEIAQLLKTMEVLDSDWQFLRNWRNQ